MSDKETIFEHVAFDAETGKPRKLTASFDSHGIVITPEGAEPIVIDVCRGEVSILLGEDDGRLIGKSQDLVGCPYCNPNGPNAFEDEYACRQGGGPCGE